MTKIEPLTNTQRELAALLQTSTRSIRRLMKETKGFPQPLRIGHGKLLRWSRAAIHKYLDAGAGK
jgi:predicted DNA-binding transcriptional regulator AlpA